MATQGLQDTNNKIWADYSCNNLTVRDNLKQSSQELTQTVSVITDVDTAVETSLVIINTRTYTTAINSSTRFKFTMPNLTQDDILQCSINAYSGTY